MTGTRIAERIEAARHDPEELGRIADELQGVSGAEAARLRLHAVLLRRRAKAYEAPAPPLSAWLSDLGLPAIDARPLHRYRLSDAGFASLERDLRKQTSSLRLAPTPVLAARFALWAAEWFRRRYDGSGLRWDRLGAVLGMHAEQHEWRRLADAGLKHWRVPELWIGGFHYRLAAIARQGGFPMAAVEGQGAGWAPRFLERLVGRLLAEPDQTLEVADGLAATLMDDVPETWRSPEIRLVSAELAMEVVRLRALVAEAGLTDGALVPAWLDAHHEGWRDELPIGVSGALGRTLVDGLMRTAVLGGGAGAVSIERRLALTPEGRRERVELALDGELRDDAGRAIARDLDESWNRLRLVPSGRFAQYASGELATAEPGGAGAWIARPSLARTVFDLPTDVAVTAELRGSGQRVGEPFVLPGGGAVASGLRVYATRLGGGGDCDLTLIGTGSGGYRPERLLVDVGSDWTCTPNGPEAVAERVGGDASPDRALWAVEGGAVATSPRGDRYLVRTGQKGDARDRLLLTGRDAQGCAEPDEGLRVLLGPPDLRVCEGRRERAAASGETWWRPSGTRSWKGDPARAGLGACEFAWRDATTGHVRALVAAVILPVGFTVERRRAADWIEVDVNGWPGRVEVDGGTRGPSGWRFPLRGSARNACTIRLLGDGPAIVLTAPLPHLAWIHDWGEGPMDRNAQLSLSTIHRYLARTDGRCELLADLLDRDRRPVAQARTSWWVDGELPMSAVRDDLAALLRPLADLDAVVKLKFNDGRDNSWFVGEFDHVLERSGRGWTPSRAVVDEEARIVGRALHAPAVERDFGPYGLAEALNHRPMELPALPGDWIVYLRAPDRALSRPRFIRGFELTNAPNTPLSKAMAVLDAEGRRAALREVVDAATEEPSNGRAIVRAAIDLALSLRGLPPSTFDVLRLLPDRPLFATMMLFQAAPEEVEPILRLAEGLPLAWPLLSAACWRAAEEAQAAYLFEAVPDQPALVAEVIGGRRRLIADREPALAGVLHQAVGRQSLFQAANAFLNRSEDRVQSAANPFRPDPTGAMPEWTVDELFWRALDAPVAAAFAAAGRTALDAAEVTCVKDIARRHPRWFRDGFQAASSEIK